MTLVFQDLELRDKGPEIAMRVTRGHDFWEDAKALIRKKADAARDAEEVFLGVYDQHVDGRLVLKTADAYWTRERWVVSPLYYWWGEKALNVTQLIEELSELREAVRRKAAERDNDTRVTAELRAAMRRKTDEMNEVARITHEAKNDVYRRNKEMNVELDKMKMRIRYLEIKSSDAVKRERVWNARTFLPLNELEQLCSESEPLEDLTTICKEIEKVSRMSSHVRSGMFPVLQMIRPPAELWKDWHSRGPQFAGWVHKVSAVLLTHNVESMDYVDVLFEFISSLVFESQQQDVVLHLVSKMVFIFELQMERQYCWGCAMDSHRVMFVCCDRELRIRVSEPISLLDERSDNVGPGLVVLARFLRGAPSLRGCVPVVLPQLWGRAAVSSIFFSRDGAVFGIDENVVAKVSSSMGSISNDLYVLRILQKAAADGLVSPLLKECEMSTGNVTWPYGIQFAKHRAVAVENEADVVRVVGGAFWRLAVLHELGYVHGDVKPQNLLVDADRILLCDFGHTTPGTGRDLQGGTPAFRVVEGLFRECDFQCDLEGLFWTAVVLWEQLLYRRRQWKALVEDKRILFWAKLRTRWDYRPYDPCLSAYLCGQANEGRLVSPRDVLKGVAPAATFSEWRENARNEISRQKLLSACPDEILQWFFDRKEKTK